MRIDGNKYIWFELLTDTGKTQTWAVVNKASGFHLGNIQWYGAWRQYTFMPVESSEYNNVCLDVICSFLTRLNKEKRITEKALAPIAYSGGKEWKNI